MKTLPDYLSSASKLVIVGCNPSLTAARTGFYYSGRGNQFWPLLYDSGIIPERLAPADSHRVADFAIGLTDLVKRPTRGSDGLTKGQFGSGRVILHQKLRALRAPKLIIFNGKIVYEKFLGKPCNYGLQDHLLYGAQVYVVPSTSRRCARKSYVQKLRHFRKACRLLRAEPATFQPATANDGEQWNAVVLR